MNEYKGQPKLKFKSKKDVAKYVSLYFAINVAIAVAVIFVNGGWDRVNSFEPHSIESLKYMAELLFTIVPFSLLYVLFFPFHKKAKPNERNKT